MLIKTIDSHVHILRNRLEAFRIFYHAKKQFEVLNSRNGTISDYRKLMHPQIDNALIFHSNFHKEGKTLAKSNEYISRISLKDTRFKPVYIFSRQLPDNFDHDFSAVKLHPEIQKIKVNEPEFSPLYKFCSKNKIPIILHMGKLKNNSDPTTPEILADLIKEFPGIVIILAHLGGEPNKELINLLKIYQKNIYLDTAGKNDALILRQMLKVVGPERILFGSDYPWFEPNEEIKKLKKNIPDKCHKKILHENAKQIFKL